MGIAKCAFCGSKEVVDAEDLLVVCCCELCLDAYQSGGLLALEVRAGPQKAGAIPFSEMDWTDEEKALLEALWPSAKRRAREVTGRCHSKPAEE